MKLNINYQYILTTIVSLYSETIDVLIPMLDKIEIPHVWLWTEFFLFRTFIIL